MVPTLGAAAGVGASEESGFIWGNNKACAVLSPTHVRCFPTEAAMEAATSSPSASSPSSDGSTDTVSTMSTSALYCAGRSDLWLYLYEHPNFGGRVLKFRDAGIWQNLTVWDFNDKMSSWRNDTFCTVYLAEHINGGGTWLFAGGRSSSAYVGDAWNDRVSSLYITY